MRTTGSLQQQTRQITERAGEGHVGSSKCSTSSANGGVEGDDVGADAGGAHAIEQREGLVGAGRLAREHGDEARIQEAVRCDILRAAVQPIEHRQRQIQAPFMP